jgi:hypothetical protein
MLHNIPTCFDPNDPVQVHVILNHSYTRIIGLESKLNLKKYNRNDSCT